jgi:hypothetical protein
VVKEEFSNFWLVMSILIFVVVELVVGGLIGGVIVGKYVSPMFHLKVQMLLNLGAYFMGGILIGVLSPGVRIIEPAVGAFISVAVVLMISWFLPYTFMRMDFGKMLLGGGIAFFLALAGARIGERSMGNIR